MIYSLQYIKILTNYTSQQYRSFVFLYFFSLKKLMKSEILHDQFLSLFHVRIYSFHVYKYILKKKSFRTLWTLSMWCLIKKRCSQRASTMRRETKKSVVAFLGAFRFVLFQNFSRWNRTVFDIGRITFQHLPSFCSFFALFQQSRFSFFIS